jgi:hypothetical protein
MKVVEKLKSNKNLDLYCEKCLKAIEKDSDVFVSGSWSLFGYVYFCCEDCFTAMGYKLKQPKPVKNKKG